MSKKICPLFYHCQSRVSHLLQYFTHIIVDFWSWGCKHPCSINCAVIRVFFRWTHISLMGLTAKAESRLVHWATTSTHCSYRHFRCMLLLREDSYSSSAFPPCESQPIDLLRYRLALPVACFLPQGHWLIPVFAYLGQVLTMSNLHLDNANMWSALTSSYYLR